MCAILLADAPGVAMDVTPDILHALAPNADEWTYGGTNTWLVAGGPRDHCVVVDPGTAEDAHLNTLRRAAEARGWTIAAVALTHGHTDHSDGARELADAAGVPVIGHPEAPVDVALDDGACLGEFGAAARVLYTPGHSDDSLCFELGGTHLLTGDTLLGGHSSGIYGEFGDHLWSLERIIRLSEGRTVAGLPGHGSYIPNIQVAAAQVRSARLRRMEQVQQGIAAHPRVSADELTASIYPSVTSYHRPSATQMVIGIAKYLLEADHNAAADLREAYRRLAAERLHGL